MLSVVMFNLHILFKSKYGRRFSEKSIAAKRALGFEPARVIVYCGDYFGIFDIWLKPFLDYIRKELC
jgi:hypothetical protein